MSTVERAGFAAELWVCRSTRRSMQQSMLQFGAFRAATRTGLAASTACAIVLAMGALNAGAVTTAPVAFVEANRIALPPADTVAGYVALLLVNETPFPGERGWVSEEDTRAAMLSILWVLENRLRHVPPGYRQEQLAAQRCNDIIDVITAGGERGQCDGFHRDAAGRFVAVPRVHERVAYLVDCANRGEPGRFARLINYASQLASDYTEDGIGKADRFADLTGIGEVAVTGRAYSWMTARNIHHPGGNFVKIPDTKGGVLGGNRFFTLKKLD